LSYTRFKSIYPDSKKSVKPIDEEARRRNKENMERMRKKILAEVMGQDTERLKNQWSYQREGWHEQWASECMEQIHNELKKQGFIKSGERYSLQLNRKELIVNDKILPADIHKRCVEIYQEFSKNKDPNSNFIIKGTDLPCD
jgi:ribosomal protein S8